MSMLCLVTVVVFWSLRGGVKQQRWWWRPTVALKRLERQKVVRFPSCNHPTSTKKNHPVAINMERVAPRGYHAKNRLIRLPLSNHSVSLLDFWLSLCSSSIGMHVMWASSDAKERAMTFLVARTWGFEWIEYLVDDAHLLFSERGE